MSGGGIGTIRILHVDDDPEFTELAAEFLERHDERFDIETATSAGEGLDRLAEREYDCIVSDFDMAGRNGIEFLRAVREDHPELPFVLYTGKGSEEVASESISAGVTDYLQKETGTSQYEVLANRIRNAVGKFHTQRELDRSQDLLERSEQFVDIGGWEADVDTGEQRWTEGTYAIHDIDPDSEYEPTVDTAVAFYHSDDQDEIERLVERCLETGEPYDTELRLLTADGRLRWVRTTGEPVRQNGEVVKIRGAIKDITERKERERKLQRYERIVENLPVGVFRTTTDGEIVSMNEAAVSLLDGESKADFSDISVEDLYADSAAREELLVEAEQEGIVEDHLIQVETLAGERRWMELTVTMVEENDDRYLDGILLEASEGRERTEGAFETLLSTATNPVFILDPGRDEFVDCNAAAADLVGVSRERLRSEQSPSQTHPDEVMDRFRAFLDRVVQEGTGRTDEVPILTDDGDVRPVELSATSLELEGRPFVVTEVRDVTGRTRDTDRPDETEPNPGSVTGTAELEPVDLAVIAAELATYVETTYGVTVETDLPEQAFVTANAGIRSVVDNLLENAVEHSDADEPRLAVAVATDDDTVTLTVSDNGPGLPDERRETLFDAHTGETGAGDLSLAKTLVDRYGGSIRVEDDEPRGTRFVVDLPRADGRPETAFV